jgi:uncharacterized protein (TIGR00369 family)
MEDLIVRDHPDNRCFGCSPNNPAGLQMAFRQTDERTVETEYTVSESFCGAPGVIHGGVQAALLDEACGFAAHVEDVDDVWNIVTVDFKLRYRRPAPTGVKLRVVGRLVRVEGRDLYMEADLIGPDDVVLTRSEARWRRIDR